MLYLDNAASTQMNKEVLQEMICALEAYGNTEAKFYSQAEQAKKLVELSRVRVAEFANAKPEEVIFTGGATESNNLVLKGTFYASPNLNKRIVTTAIEHSSVHDTCLFLQSQGADVVMLSVNREGKIDLNELENSLTRDTVLVSIIYVNNEIGTIQDLEAIDEICKRHKVMLHIDATQAAGKVDIDFAKYKALTYVTFTAHKIFGPKGIGCLICRTDEFGERVGKMIPLLHGGEQEYGLRAGTVATELIVGFGKACEIAKRDWTQNHQNVERFEKIILQKLHNKFGDKMILNNDFHDRIAGLLNVRLKGYNNMVLLKAISQAIAASTGSACAVSKPSRILAQIGLSETEINESIRLSVSPYEDEKNLDMLDLL